MISETIKNLLGEELTTQVLEALKGKGKEGRDVDIVIGNDGSYVPAEKYDIEKKGKASAETALKQAAEALKAVGGSGDPAKIADDVKAAQTKIDDLSKTHKAELSKIQKVSALRTALSGKVHDPDDIINLLDLDKVEVTDVGALKSDIDELVKPYKETKSHYFIEEKPAEKPETNINGAQPAGSSAQPPKKDVSSMTYSELVAYMASNPNAEI